MHLINLIQERESGEKLFLLFLEAVVSTDNIHVLKT